MAKKKSPKQIISKNNDIPNTLPNNVKQEDFLIVLDNISKRLANKFRFAYHNFDDMKQQAAIFALEGLEKYDNSRPLENFLWTHVRNRLFNYKRNNYQRPDKPCLTCPLYDKAYKSSNSQCLKYSDKSECDLFSSWSTRNETKKNIIQPATIENDIFFCENTNTIDNSNMNIAPEEYAIDPNWIINEDKEYILNYIFKIGFPILKHKFKWRY